MIKKQNEKKKVKLKKAENNKQRIWLKANKELNNDY